MLLRVIVFIACVWMAAGSAAAEVVQANHARLELLSEQTSLAVGRQSLLAIHFSLEKGWHIYWINPGDSGQPPSFEWQLPAGLSVGEVEWPRPERLERAHLTDYGYQDEAMLLVPVQVSRDYNGGADAKIGVQAKWLICREVCIADQARLHMALPVSASSAVDPDHSKVFADAMKVVPKPWPRSWRVRAIFEKDDLVLFIQAGKPFQQVEFFPLEPNQIENNAHQSVKATAQGARITLKKSDQLLKPITVLRGVVALADGESYQVQARVTPARPKAHNNSQLR